MDYQSFIWLMGCLAIGAGITGYALALDELIKSVRRSRRRRIRRAS